MQRGPRRRGLRTVFRSPLLLGSVFLFLVQTTTARAQTDGAAAAEVLFHEGAELRRQGQFAEACEKFEESQRLDPAAGTLLNLGDCREAEGKLATAWSLFEEARKTAATSFIRDEAQARAQAVHGRLGYLQIQIQGAVAGQVVRYGNLTLGRPAYGTRVPVDPGELVVSATAPGYVGWEAKVRVDEGTTVVHVPELRKIVSPVIAPEPATRPVGPWIVGAAGIASLGVGATLGFLAKGHYDSAEGLCPSHTNCSDAAMSEWGRADAFATASTVLVPLGALAAAGGVIWWMMSDPKTSTSARLPQVLVSESGGFISVRGAF